MRLTHRIFPALLSHGNPSGTESTLAVGMHYGAVFHWFAVPFAVRGSAVHRLLSDCHSLKSLSIGSRYTFFLLCCVFAACFARGEDLTTTTGKSYHEIQVLSRSSTALLIQSREGEYQLALTDLKPTDRDKF